MAYDGLVMAAITHELTDWVDARIEKIYQPAPAVLLLSLHHPRLGKSKLLLSADANARLHLTDSKWNNPASPPMFCMLLRKHLESSRLVGVEQFGLERVIVLSLSGRDDLGNSVIYRLIAEVMGRHSNILLVSHENKILDSIIRVPPAMSSVRIVLPGLTYDYPVNQDRLDTLLLRDREQLVQLLHTDSEQAVGKALVARLTGISPLLASELSYRAGVDPKQAVASISQTGWQPLFEQLLELQELVRDRRWQPSRVGKQFAALPLTHLASEPWSGSMNELVDLVSSEGVLSNNLQKQKQQLTQVLRQLLQKNKRKHQNQSEELLAMQQDLELRRQGELILSSLHQIPAKAERATVIDYYDPELATVEIALNPQLTPSQNAKRLFKRYERARHGIPIVEKNLAATWLQITYLESLLDSIERADQPSLLVEIEQEMRQGNFLPAEKKKSKAAPASVQNEPLRFLAADGAEVLVGRNNLQNERLTRSADPEDWWLHVKDIPGSHVLVRGSAGELAPATLELAAGLAAYFSQARQSSKVPVDYTRRKHVRKPSGAPPGFVIYTHQQTVLIAPLAPTAEQQ